MLLVFLKEKNIAYLVDDKFVKIIKIFLFFLVNSPL